MLRCHRQSDDTATTKVDTPIPNRAAASGAVRMQADIRSGKDRGAAAVEMALALPILLLILTGICTFGIAFNNYLMLTQSVTVGAQLLSISRGQTTDPCATTVAAVYNAAPLLAQANFTFRLILTNPSTGTASTYNGTSCTGAAANLLQGYSAEVIANYPCNLAVYGVNYAPSCSLQAALTEVVQ
jgi:Flp pilus assembly protein TadG